MIKRVFVDADVLLDVALVREPFVESSRLVLALLENTIAMVFISGIVSYITVISIDHSDVVYALKSPFTPQIAEPAPIMTFIAR